MASQRFSRLKIAQTVVALLLLNAFSLASEKVIYTFAGDSDGEYADTELVRDASGNLYGTTVQGGIGAGTVFQITPSGVHTVLYQFTGGTDGGEPYKGVTLDAQGNLYGTAVIGGLYSGACADTSCGVIYKLTNSGGVWTQSVVYSFRGLSDGYGPGSPVVFDRQGNMYGVAPTGGAGGAGVIFQLTPDGQGGWKFHIVHSFTGGNDGNGGSAGRLLVDSSGSIFGVATAGGKYGAGTAFEVSPTSEGWKFTLLYAFKGSPDAGFPYSGLILGPNGGLYGTTYYDGANDLGSVFELANVNGIWRERTLYNFKGGSDGASPISTLIADKAGNLYGTTSEGGSEPCSCGTIFKMSRSGSGTWTETVMYSFANSPDGAFAYNGLVGDGAGNFWGTTVAGGDSDGDGAVYQFTP